MGNGKYDGVVLGKKAEADPEPWIRECGERRGRLLLLPLSGRKCEEKPNVGEGDTIVFVSGVMSDSGILRSGSRSGPVGGKRSGLPGPISPGAGPPVRLSRLSSSRRSFWEKGGIKSCAKRSGSSGFMSRILGRVVGREGSVGGVSRYVPISVFGNATAQIQTTSIKL